MPIEITLLGWTVVLGIVQVLLAAGAKRRQDGTQWAMGSRDEPRPPPTGVAGRLARAEANFMESFPFFAAAIVAVHVTGREGALSALGAQLFFWSRLVYVPLYASGVPVVRSIIWGASMVGLVQVVLALLLPH